MLAEKMQSVDQILRTKDYMEEKENFDFAEADISAFDHDMAKFQKFH